jgi:hypothetical protein
MRYVKRPDVSHVTIPGVGVVQDQILEGPQFERFVPGKLRYYSGPAVTPTLVLEPVAEPVAVVTTTDPEPSVPETTPAEQPAPEEAIPSRAWTRAELVTYAESKGLSGEGTKAEILERILA